MRHGLVSIFINAGCLSVSEIHVHTVYMANLSVSGSS